MPNIKPINTVYNGYRFRSRLEARWAVYFDLLHVKYEYESEGYVLENGITYLPDFYLPDVKAFFEVKPYHMETGDMSAARGKLELLAKAKDCFAMICRGDPVDNEIRIYPFHEDVEDLEFSLGQLGFQQHEDLDYYDYKRLARFGLNRNAFEALKNSLEY